MSNNTNERKADYQDPWAETQADETSQQNNATDTTSGSDPWSTSSESQTSTESDPWGSTADTSTPSDTGGSDWLDAAPTEGINTEHFDIMDPFQHTLIT